MQIKNKIYKTLYNMYECDCWRHINVISYQIKKYKIIININLVVYAG